jgi:hypothetical protein
VDKVVQATPYNLRTVSLDNLRELRGWLEPAKKAPGGHVPMLVIHVRLKTEGGKYSKKPPVETYLRILFFLAIETVVPIKERTTGGSNDEE